MRAARPVVLLQVNNACDRPLPDALEALGRPVSTRLANGSEQRVPPSLLLRGPSLFPRSASLIVEEFSLNRRPGNWRSTAFDCSGLDGRLPKFEGQIRCGSL